MYNTSSSPIITEKQNKDAQVLSSKLGDTRARKRAYIDFAGAMFLVDYLQNLGLRVNTKKSIFTCTKLYSDFEIIDIYANSHMLYCITTYGTEVVRIPSIHKEYDILPEAYIVVDVKLGMKQADVKGVITPDMINDCNRADGNLRFDINKLKPISSISAMLKSYAGIKPSRGKHLECMNLFVPYIDGKIKPEEKQRLIAHILTCATCRNKLIETIEFDSKSKNVSTYHSILSKEDLSTQDNFVRKMQTPKAPENSVKVKGAIDVIYKNKALNELKETVAPPNIIKYRAEEPSFNVKRLCIAATTIFAIIALLVGSILFIPKSQADDETDKTVEGAMLDDSFIAELPDEEAISEFDVSVPKISGDRNYTNISKVSWEVASNVQKDSEKKFLQAAGKSIRLNLQNDLLLSNDVALKDNVKFEIRFLRDGTLETINVSQSSGTKAVDEIIKQSVENTLYYMRPPKGSFTSRKSGLTLVITF